MCDESTTSVAGEMASAAGTLAGAVWAIAKVSRWPVLYVLLAGALWYYRWWLIGFTVPLGAIGGLIMWRAHRRVVADYAGPSPAMAALLAQRGLKPIPATAAARPALPRAMRRSILRLPRRQPALPPAPPKAITGVVISPARARVTR